MARWKRAIGRAIDEEEVPSALRGVWGTAPQSETSIPGRDLTTIANALPAELLMTSSRASFRALSRVSPVIRSELTEFEDDRKFSPGRLLRPLQTPRGAAKILAPRAKAWSPSGRPSRYSLATLKFKDNKHAVICVRRKIRKEVMMATGKGGANRQGRRKASSNIWC